MQRAVVLLSFFLAVTVPTVSLADAFCAGFQRGYEVGYMRGAGTTLPPLVPLCPLQPLKRLSDPDSDYEHGFIIGYEQGQANGYRRRPNNTYQSPRYNRYLPQY